MDAPVGIPGAGLAHGIPRDRDSEPGILRGRRRTSATTAVPARGSESQLDTGLPAGRGPVVRTAHDVVADLVIGLEHKPSGTHGSRPWLLRLEGVVDENAARAVLS